MFNVETMINNIGVKIIKTNVNFIIFYILI